MKSVDRCLTTLGAGAEAHRIRAGETGFRIRKKVAFGHGGLLLKSRKVAWRPSKLCEKGPSQGIHKDSPQYASFVLSNH
jgi:hypothetical protein